MASSSIGWTIEASASEGEPAVPPTSAKNFSMEPEGIDAAVEEVQRETAAEAVEAISPLGITLIFVSNSFLIFIMPCSNKVLPQVFRLWVHRLQGSQPIFLRELGVK